MTLVGKQQKAGIYTLISLIRESHAKGLILGVMKGLNLHNTRN